MPPPRSFLRCCRRPRWSRCLASGSQFSLPPQMQWLSTEVDCCHWHIGFHICGVCLHMPPFLRLFTHLVKKIALCSGGQNCLFLMPPSATVWCDHSIVLFLQLLRQGVPDSCTSLFYFFNISDSIFPRKSFSGVIHIGVSQNTKLFFGQLQGRTSHHCLSVCCRPDFSIYRQACA